MPFLANALIYIPLKTPENLCSSGVFSGYKIGILAINGLKQALVQRYSMKRSCANFLKCVSQEFWILEI